LGISFLYALGVLCGKSNISPTYNRYSKLQGFIAFQAGGLGINDVAGGIRRMMWMKQ